MMGISFSLAQMPGMRKVLVEEMRAGKIFIYPTDTIYGMGCNALKTNSVKKIKAIKKRNGKKPLSVIAPTKKWIRKHCVVRFPTYLNQIPGPYTLLLPKKNSSFLHSASANAALGVRMISHPFQKMVTQANVPFVTTSVNLTGEPPVHRITNIPPSILEKVDFVLDAGILKNLPSTLIDLTGKKPLRIRRK
jgi:L-threonylcarbamoyladenylate synthase